jgi:serine/threonine-protein kinase RsbW
VTFATYTAVLDNLALIRRYVAKIACDLQAEQAAIDDMVQAVDEAVANIILHGYAGKPGALEIEVSREDTLLVVRLRDQASQFDPTRVPPPDLSTPLEKRPLGGLGIYLINQFVDQLQYRAIPQDGNELTLMKKAF